jgi:hypothetical protein
LAGVNAVPESPSNGGPGREAVAAAGELWTRMRA